MQFLAPHLKIVQEISLQHNYLKYMALWISHLINDPWIDLVRTLHVHMYTRPQPYYIHGTSGMRAKMSQDHALTIHWG